MERVGKFKVGDKITAADVANIIDHSLLRPDITVDELKQGCDIAKKYKCISVCVRPSDIPIVKEELKDSNVLVTTVIAFPHGTATKESKVFETEDAVKKGATEVDMVMNVARFLSEEFQYVEDEIKAVVDVAHKYGAEVKVIFENHYLTTDQIRIACEIAERSGADFVKTSTGYAPTGSKIEDLKTMRAACSPNVGVKAAGGVRDLDSILAIMATGTVRVGTRSTIAIMEEAIKREKEGNLVIK